ncbi:unnamed protein product [Didymodactylos carnosus]|uniref:Uncharacterized protein n=1 Tax=Didymodactylos carnosus TaxID=1234261 RepID=A0A816BF13_9BILA|nr:unnamed protein product [Didymodactylos carnosus]CAF1608333.1 unnamed protein product [Didymodactylos carnosus]CAF3763986.1 unnamed protein product [Didymodactylos carnosus]CAF4489660.1 unnamed protein product [Didymodactylos carnosus]
MRLLWSKLLINMTEQHDNFSNQLSKLSINQQPSDVHDNEHQIPEEWLIPKSISLGYFFLCPMTLAQLITQQCATNYFQQILVFIEQQHHIRNFRMKLSEQRGRELGMSIHYKEKHYHRGPVDCDLCISCDVDNDLSRLSIIKENINTRIWLDAQLRTKLIVTPRRHVERLSEMTSDEMAKRSSSSRFHS